MVSEQAKHLEPMIDHAPVLHDFVWIHALFMQSHRI
jgi:hypothetical protein